MTTIKSLVAPLALAAGPSCFTTERVTQHLLTNAWVVNQFLPGRVRVAGEEGQGLSWYLLPPMRTASADP